MWRFEDGPRNGLGLSTVSRTTGKNMYHSLGFDYNLLGILVMKRIPNRYHEDCNYP